MCAAQTHIICTLLPPGIKLLLHLAHKLSFHSLHAHTHIHAVNMQISCLFLFFNTSHLPTPTPTYCCYFLLLSAYHVFSFDVPFCPCLFFLVFIQYGWGDGSHITPSTHCNLFGLISHSCYSAEPDRLDFNLLRCQLPSFWGHYGIVLSTSQIHFYSKLPFDSWGSEHMAQAHSSDLEHAWTLSRVDRIQLDMGKQMVVSTFTQITRQNPLMSPKFVVWQEERR